MVGTVAACARGTEGGGKNAPHNSLCLLTSKSGVEIRGLRRYLTWSIGHRFHLIDGGRFSMREANL